MSEPRQFSEHTAQVIDEEVHRLLSDAAEQATQMLVSHRDKLDAMATALESEETLDARDIEKLIGPPAYPRKTDVAAGDGRVKAAE